MFDILQLLSNKSTFQGRPSKHAQLMEHGLQKVGLSGRITENALANRFVDISILSS